MKVTDDDYKKVLIDTFKSFHKLCEQYNLKYFSAYGTLIGAIRHKGLIPWDDDIDVYMLRDDYQKLSNLKGKIDDHYDIADYRDENYWFPVIKYCDTNTTIWEHDKFDCVHGIYIDVFPIDEYDSNSSAGLRDEFFDLCIKYQRTQMKHNFKYLVENLLHRNFKGTWFCLENIIRYLGKKDVYKKLYYDKLEEVKLVKGDKYMAYFGPYGRQKELIEKEWLDGRIEVPFEDTIIYIPSGYDDLLKRLYGNYLTLPPVEKQITHHDRLYVNLDKGMTLDEVKSLIKS